jgi:hypothetical protein
MKIDYYDNILKVSDEDIANILTRYSDHHQNVWDPAEDFSIDKITRNSSKVLAKYEKLKKDPGLPVRQRQKALRVILILIACSFAEMYFFGHFYSTFIIGVIGYLAYNGITQYYKKLGIDLVKISIALEKNWFYDPLNDFSKWQSLVNKYPEAFMRGNDEQNVEDQLWGKYSCNNQEYDSYSGLFHYTRVTRSSKGGTSKKMFEKNFFCLRLLKPLKTRFYLFTDGTDAKSSEIKSNPVSTESVEFNKNFSISCEKDGENILEIMKILSPAVQVRLTDLVKAKGPYGILFSENCIFYVFNGPFFKQVKSDLFTGVDMSPEDRTYFETEFSSLINLTTDLTRYFD